MAPGLSEAVRCPGFPEGRFLDSAAMIVKGDDMARRGYPPEFRRRVVELVEGGRWPLPASPDPRVFSARCGAFHLTSFDRRWHNCVSIATTKELLAMARLAPRGSRAFSLATLILAVLLPTVASARWGEQNWGEMVWGRAVIPVPSLSMEGLIALAVLLVFISATLLLRHRRNARP